MLGSSGARVKMLRGHFTLPAAIESFLDPVIMVALLFAVGRAHGDTLGPPYVILGLLVFSLMFPGDLQFHDSLRRMARKTVLNWIFVAGVLLLFGYASGYIHFFPEEVILTWIGAAPLVLLGAHLLARSTLPRVMSLEGNQRICVIAGCNEIGLKLAENFVGNPFLGLHFVGFFDDRSRARLDGIGPHALLGDLDTLAQYVNRHPVDHIYLALPMASQPRILKTLDDLKDTTSSIFFAPDIFVTDLIQGRLDDVAGIPVVGVCESPFTGVDGLLKRGSDVLLAIVILILISPLMLGIALGVKWSSPGPVIFRQRRYGLDGKEIVVYKFRSMTVCEDGGEIRQARKDDARITPFGAILRRTSLDELPQFINVLQGRMSIVGPRPHAIAHNETYRKLIKGYMVRHKVRPGITGWAQVNGLRGETETIDKMERRIAYDLEYLRNWSLGLDIWIVIKTILIVLRDKQAY